MTLDTKKVVAIGALCVALTQTGNLLKGVSYLVGVPETAYAARSKAEDVDDKFQQYLAKQDAVAEALNKYVGQQQQQQQMPKIGRASCRERV